MAPKSKKAAAIPEEKPTHEVEFGEFANNRIFRIWKIDDEGKRDSNFPALAFGESKAKLIVKHIEKLKEFVNEGQA